MHAYTALAHSEITGGKLMEAVSHLGSYQRDPDWGTDECEIMLMSLLRGFGKQYEENAAARAEGDTSEVKIDKIFSLGKMVFAREVTTDAFGIPTLNKEYIVDGQQRKRNLSLVFIAINKLYPNLQLGGLIPFAKDSDGILKPVVTHSDTDEYVYAAWKYKGIMPEPSNPSSAVKMLDTNYRYLVTQIKELAWSDEKMEAFLAVFAENVRIGITTVLVEDAAKAFMEANTNQATLRQFQLMKAGVSSHLIHNPELADQFCLMYDKNVEKLKTVFEIAKGKIDDFIISMARAMYAVDTGTTGEKSLDSLNRPFSWIEQNAERIGLNTDKDWEELAFKHIPHLFRVLFLLLEAERTYKLETRHIKERAVLGGDYAHALMLAITVIHFDDTDEQILAKLNFAARLSMKLTDKYERSGRRRLDGKVRPNIVELIKAIRGKTLPEAHRAANKFFEDLEKQFKEEGYYLSSQVREGAANFNGHTLRAVETTLKIWAGEETTLPQLWDTAKSSNPLTIEHMIPTTYGANGETAFSPFEAPGMRELLALQGMLPKTFNSSIQDKPINEKTAVYLSKGGNWLASVSPDFYTGKGRVISARLAEQLKQQGIKLSPLPGDEITMEWTQERSDAFNALLDIYHDLGEAPVAVPGDCDYGAEEGAVETEPSTIVGVEEIEAIATELKATTLNVAGSESLTAADQEEQCVPGETVAQASDTSFNVGG